MHTYAGTHFTALCTHTLGSWQLWLEQVYLSQQRREKNGNLLLIDVLVSLRCCGFVNQYQQVSLPIYKKNKAINVPIQTPVANYNATTLLVMLSKFQNPSV